VTTSRLAALRPAVLVAGVASTVLALLLVFFILGWVGSSRDTQNQRAEDAAIARVLAGQVGMPARPTDLAPYRGVLVVENQRATVKTGSASFSVGATLPPDHPHTQVTQPIDGGTITVSSPIDSTLDPPIEYVLITLAVLLVVLGSVIAANRATNRETRRRVDAAVSAAERVASGDFSVRVGSGGPEPLAPLGRAFDSMAGRLAASDREQREFLADLAHEIATPVQALSGFSQAVIDGTISKEAAGRAIESQSSRLSDLLDELTQLRGLDAPRDSQLEEVDLGDLCQTIYAEFSSIAKNEGVRLQCRSSHVHLRTDKRLVETVLRNFLTNALRYTPPGERIIIAVKRERAHALLSVSDTGPGIAPEHQERIFDRFYRTATARDRISGGTGLGLSIARGAAEALGGHIELHSELGQGSDFRLVLPMNQAIAFPSDGSVRSDRRYPTEPGDEAGVAQTKVTQEEQAISTLGRRPQA